MELAFTESSSYQHVNEVTPKNSLRIERMVWEKKAKDQSLENFDTGSCCDRELGVTENYKEAEMNQKIGQLQKLRESF